MPPRKVHFTKTWSSKHKLKRVWTSLVIMFKLPQKSARFVFVKKAHTVELSFTIFDLKVKVKCGQVWWPILWIFALHLTHPNAHTHYEHTHTHCEHTPGAVGSYLCCGARGAVGDLAQGSHLSRGIEGGESAVHSLPHRHLGYKSDSLYITPRLPICSKYVHWSLFIWIKA